MNICNVPSVLKMFHVEHSKQIIMSTTENNKLIAEFMEFHEAIVRSHKGVKYDYNIPNGFELIKETETTIESQWCEILMEQDYCMVEDLKFHSSWDWLMPVVEKIETIELEGSHIIEGEPYHNVNFGVFIKPDNTHINLYGDMTVWEQFIEPKFDGLGRLSATYNAVIEFIKWYNQKQIGL